MLDQAYKTIGAQMQIQGFSKGKVPSRIIDQRVGRGAVVQEAVDEALPVFFAQPPRPRTSAPSASPRSTSSAMFCMYLVPSYCLSRAYVAG